MSDEPDEPARDPRPGALAPPTPLARKYVRYVLGFGVGVAVGLAPYLGKVNLPLFSSLLSLIPVNVQDTLLPLSSALMGVLAVVVQWYGSEKPSRRWLRRAFKATLLFAVGFFVILLVVHTVVVVPVDILGGKQTVSFLVGFHRPYKPPCPEGVSDSDCIKEHLTLSKSKIESFWGDGQVRAAKLMLMLPYLGFTSAFGMLIGLLLLRDEAAKTAPPRRTTRRGKRAPPA